LSIELKAVVPPEDALTSYDDLAILVAAELFSLFVPSPRYWVDTAYWSYPDIMDAFNAVMVAGVVEGDVEALTAMIMEINAVQKAIEASREVCSGA